VARRVPGRLVAHVQCGALFVGCPPWLCWLTPRPGRVNRDRHAPES
jgi:hypothetical protein